METKIEKCSLSIITRLPQICKPNEFMVAFFIINTMSIEKKDRIKMYRGELADLCNMSERNISRLTDSLNNIGIIQKELIGDAEKKKTFNYYRLNWQKIDEILAEIVTENDSFLPELSGLKNERIKELKKKRIKEDKNERIENKKEFNIACGIEFDWNTELEIIENDLKECSNEIEMNKVGEKFEKLTKKHGEVPEECNEILERIKQVVDSKKCLIKT